MKTLLLILFLIITNEIFSQTFKVTDIKYIDSDNTDTEEIQEIKKRNLGAKVEMTFYDSSVKVICYTLNGKKDGEAILEPTPEKTKEYTCIRIIDKILFVKRFKMVLNLNTILNYITSATLEFIDVDDNNQPKKRSIIYTLKRD